MFKPLPLLAAVVLLAACSSSSTHKNRAPVLDAIGAQSARELVLLTFSVHATDPDGQALTLSATGLPSGATFDASGSSGSFSWTPAEGTVGSHQVTFTASDGSLSDELVVDIDVSRRAPFDPVAAAAGSTDLAQFIANDDADGEVLLPNAANIWDINTDFSLSDGGNDQWDGALTLYVGTDPDPTNDPGFPNDQTYGEITFSSPTVGAAQGFAPVSVGDGDWAEDGTYSAVLGGSADTRLSQAIDLTSATAPVTLTFVSDDYAYGGIIPMPTFGFQVAVRDGAGALLDTLGGGGPYDLSAYAGQAITLSFEQVGDGYSYAIVDDVSVQSGGEEYVVNGDFETGNLSGWTTAGAQSTNITSGARTLSDLTVTRSFYTLPTQKWGRWIDVFENTTGADISVNASYYTNLGSDGGGVIFEAADGKSLSEFDGTSGDRDIGWVFGGSATSTPSVTFTSNPTLGSWDGSGYVWVIFPITVPAGGKVAIVNFLVMTGVDTGQLVGTTLDTHPAEVEAVNAAIVAGWGTDPTYRDYMTPAQRGAVVNF